LYARHARPEEDPRNHARDPLVIEPELQDAKTLAARIKQHQGDILFNKHWFDVFTNENVTTVLGVLDPQDVVLYGVALDVCDKYAIEGLLERRPQHPALRRHRRDEADRPRRGRAPAQRMVTKACRLVKTSEVVSAFGRHSPRPDA